MTLSQGQLDVASHRVNQESLRYANFYTVVVVCVGVMSMHLKFYSQCWQIPIHLDYAVCHAWLLIPGHAKYGLSVGLIHPCASVCGNLHVILMTGINVLQVLCVIGCVESLLSDLLASLLHLLL